MIIIINYNIRVDNTCTRENMRVDYLAKSKEPPHTHKLGCGCARLSFRSCLSKCSRVEELICPPEISSERLVVNSFNIDNKL